VKSDPELKHPLLKIPALKWWLNSGPTRAPDALEPIVMEDQLQAIITVLSLVNPAICGAMFAQIEEIALAVNG
jgi:hypothetical protein